MRAQEIMTKEVLTVSPGLSVREMAEFLIKENISGAPVIDKKNNGYSYGRRLNFSGQKDTSADILESFLQYYSVWALANGVGA